MKNSIRLARCLLFVAVTLCALVGQPRLHAQVPAGAFDLPFDRSPLWVMSGVWNESGSRLFLVDSARQEIIPIGQDGSIRDAITPSLDGTGFLEFNLLKSANGQLYLDLDNVGLVATDHDFEVSADKITKVGRDNFPGNGIEKRIAAVHAWAVSDDFIYAFADIEQRAIPNWVSGFIKIPLQKPEDFEFLVELKLSLGDLMASFYQLGLNLFEASGTNVFVLVMDDPPYLVVAEPGGANRKISVASACGGRPDIPRINGGAASMTPALEALERSTGPIGVYSQDERVFLLCRQEVQQGDFQFSIAELNLTTGAAISLRPINTDAAHLVVIPGPRYWAFVQKGQVAAGRSGGPFMPIKSVMMVPSKVFTDRDLRSTATIGGESSWLDSFLKVWDRIEFAFSGVGIIILSLFFRKTRSLWCSAGKALRRQSTRALTLLISRRPRKTQGSAVESVE